MKKIFLLSAILFSGVILWAISKPLPAKEPSPLAGRDGALIIANVVALDQLLVYNRFGSFNPFGMIYALREDVVPVDTAVAYTSASDCEKPEAETNSRAIGAALEPGAVRLRDCKRPRPLALRVNVGDTLEVHFQNLLRPLQPGLTKDFCPNSFREPPAGKDNLNDAVWKDEFPNGQSSARQHCKAKKEEAGGEPTKPEIDKDWPKTRLANFAVAGLKLAAKQTDGFDRDICLGVSALPPGGRIVVCRFEINHEGPFFATSNAAMSGGEGDGGSLTHGLFASVIAEPKGSAWYRSQVSHGVLEAAWPKEGATEPHARKGKLDYEAKDGAGFPYLNMLSAEESKDGEARYRLAHSDLNAIVREPAKDRGRFSAFREFTVVLHDEMKTYYAEAYRMLGGADAQFKQLAGVRDGFGVNYGSGGMGPMLIANRKKMGPAADCVECLYEEFFLQSWANGDPALLEQFPDDPSNVHHSYLNDRVVFRNFHAGPKETHVFHLHAHQWFAGNDSGRGAYLDSQTVGPQQGFTYRIYHGGLRDQGPGGWWETHGAGNRNRAPGDSIFHCHLYPHFAQGMWELWRTHDVFEDGSRKLPDGQKSPGLSINPTASDDEHKTRAGTLPDGSNLANAEGTPIPALVPLPEEPLPLLPTYGDKGMPGYPFYIDGKPGHRAPQPPLDMALDNGKPLDAGLPRHVVKDGEREFAAGAAPIIDGAQNVNALLARSLAIGDLSADYTKLHLNILPYDGSDVEKRGMAFHHNGLLAGASGETKPLLLRQIDGSPAQFDKDKGGYSTVTISAATATAAGGAAAPGWFYVNGAPPRPGAPFADPCAIADGLNAGTAKSDPLTNDGVEFTPDPKMIGFRRYDVSAVQLQKMIVNRAGWHDPQARIDVLSSEAGDYKNKIRADAAPFFFRARSGECIELRHTNEMPKTLARDDFQVETPTDTVGQHIHLVKFDVTSSDGSANGWNYEDGTFAPDEISERICASQPSHGGSVTGGSTQLRGRVCGRKDHWKTPRLGAGGQPGWFQTTVQRWFADPILSEEIVGAKPTDRTMRTVFTHDHFGPSSIQQHGFYSALVIEPTHASICPEHVTNKEDCDRLAKEDAGIKLRIGDEKLVGPRKLVLERGDPDRKPHVADTREYALAIADFALLYDPKAPKAEIQYREATPAKGLVCLAKEAEAYARDKAAYDSGKLSLASICSGHNGGGADGVSASPVLHTHYTSDEAQSVAAQMRSAALDQRRIHGRPIAAPERPESISVDHHDPYLVNYRNEPVPLRVGARAGHENEGLGYGPCGFAAAGDRKEEDRSVAAQRMDDMGDFGETFRSIMLTGTQAGQTHGDPCTPILDVYENENIQIRLIQGAQEVQHVFTLEGVTFPRNLDQHFVSHRDFTSQNQEAEANPTWWRRCHDATVALAGADRSARASLVAACDNVDGRETGQEIGISEHFEFEAPMRREGVMQAALPVVESLARAAPRGKVTRAAPLKDLMADPVFANRMTASDFLYHFGTLDAIWNGAWGLLRVYEESKRPRVAYDIGACLDAPSDDPSKALNCIKANPQAPGSKLRPASQRLTSLTTARAILGTEDARNMPPPGAEETTLAPSLPARRPTPKFGVTCLPGAPHVRATVAAVEATALNAKGVVYHPQAPVLRDPNGRLLVLIDSEQNAEIWPAASLAAPAASRKSVIQKVKDSLSASQNFSGALPTSAIQPLVLRINAGDCLDLTLVNALDKNGEDKPGDALMPKITPLNVDTHDGWNVETGEFLAGNEPAARNARPSSHLALSIPLTATSNMSTTPSPVGVDAGGSVTPDKAARMFFYAGVLSPKDESQQNYFDDLARQFAQPFCDAEGLQSARLTKYDPGKNEQNAFIIDVLGRWFALSMNGDALPDAAHHQALAQCISDTIAKFEMQKKGFQPYAFGALPIRPLGDVFNQLPHGLAGALIVEPQGACYAGRNQPGVCVDGKPAQQAEPGQAVTLVPSQMKGSASITLKQGFDNAGEHVPPPEAALSEHVLLWQDGLNLHAENSSGDMPVADCHICDDTYDFGKKGVNYRSTPIFARKNLRGEAPYTQGVLNGAADANAVELGADIFHVKGKGAERTPIVLSARAGEEVMFRVVHPGGRARQRAFIITGNGFDDLFPGFGFPNAALLAPGKAITAALRRPLGPGCHFWHDGPRLMAGHGAWGLLEVTDENGEGACPGSERQQASSH
ncbi:hypothetical protein HUN39_03890 [Methylocystis sp. FS]|uniref:hypothetical protein n=1 Tax=Methylocystis silviterrae TaxID=2743612 RepID=UPI001581BAC4|nr:hypothetical protein [Methylocystis silviterrae]NUJ79183.1 hypothetical protein [Methylocystis silviterrae]